MASTFTDAEIDYLMGQALGRLATADAAGRPHVMPVGVFYDPDEQALVIGGVRDVAASKKFRDAARRPDVAVVVDDLATVNPWRPRGIEVRGRAETHTEGGAAVGQRVGALPLRLRLDPDPSAPHLGLGHRRGPRRAVGPGRVRTPSRSAAS